jgi:hypothetical protein
MARAEAFRRHVCALCPVRRAPWALLTSIVGIAPPVLRSSAAAVPPRHGGPPCAHRRQPFVRAWPPRFTLGGFRQDPVPPGRARSSSTRCGDGRPGSRGRREDTRAPGTSADTAPPRCSALPARLALRRPPLSCFATPRVAREAPFRRLGTDHVFAVVLGQPQGLSVAVGIVVGSVPARPVRCAFGYSTDGVLLQAEPGLSGGKVSLGAATTNGLFGVGAKASLLRTWGKPWGTRPDPHVLEGGDSSYWPSFERTSAS